MCAAIAIFSIFGVVILAFFGILIITDSKSFAIVDSISLHKTKKAQGCFIAAGMYLVLVIVSLAVAIPLSLKMRRANHQEAYTTIN